MTHPHVTAEQAKDAVFAAKSPFPGTLDPGKVGAIAIPAFLIPLAQQVIAQYGPAAVAFLEQAAVAAINELATHFNLIPVATAPPAPPAPPL